MSGEFSSPFKSGPNQPRLRCCYKSRLADSRMKRALHDHVMALRASSQTRSEESFLDGASASDQVVYQYDHSYDQQEMNQACTATYTEYKTQ